MNIEIKLCSSGTKPFNVLDELYHYIDPLRAIMSSGANEKRALCDVLMKYKIYQKIISWHLEAPGKVGHRESTSPLSGHDS